MCGCKRFSGLLTFPLGTESAEENERGFGFIHDENDTSYWAGQRDQEEVMRSLSPLIEILQVGELAKEKPRDPT